MGKKDDMVATQQADVIDVLSESWGVSSGEIQTAMSRENSVRERIERLRNDPKVVDLGNLHADIKLVLMDERPRGGSVW